MTDELCDDMAEMGVTKMARDLHEAQSKRGPMTEAKAREMAEAWWNQMFGVARVDIERLAAFLLRVAKEERAEGRAEEEHECAKRGHLTAAHLAKLQAEGEKRGLERAAEVVVFGLRSNGKSTPEAFVVAEAIRALAAKEGEK